MYCPQIKKKLFVAKMTFFFEKKVLKKYKLKSPDATYVTHMLAHDHIASWIS